MGFRCWSVRDTEIVVINYKMSHEILAENSKNLAKKFAKEGNFGKALSHFLVAFTLKPDLKTQYKEEFSTALCKWGTLLDEKNQLGELFKCYELAVEVFPNDVVILNNLGAHLLRCGLLKESAHYFRKCLAVDPYFLRAGHNLENVLNLAVERWHFRMLNDQHRNEAFREAIIKKIQQGFDRVLDVGTGTGILSLFCSEGKAKQIYACDSSTIMTEIAEQVFHSNNVHDVKLINKHSSELIIPEDILGRVSLLVTETFDAGLLGEDILQTLAHAWKHLLLPPRSQSADFGIVIPFGATVYTVGIEFDAVANEPHPANLFSFENHVVRVCDNYDTQDLSRARFKCLTECEKILEISFNDPNAIDELLQGWERNFALRCKNSGRLDCFAVWFDLRLDEDIVLSTSPFQKSGAWDQAIFPLPRSEYVEEEQNITITVAFKNKLSICVFNPGNRYELSESSIKILNNKKLSTVLNQVVQKLNCSFDDSVNVLDCYPFPVFGLNFLINRKTRFKDELTCFVPTESDRRLVNAMAEKYNIAIDVRIKMEIDEDLQKKFDIILVDLVELNGELKDEVLLQFDYLRSLLKPNGIILPDKVSAIGQFIHSDWLTEVSKVKNESVTCGYNIADHINKYQVRHFIDLDFKSIEALHSSEPFELFNALDCFDSVNEMKVPRHPDNTLANALVYWFKIRFFEGCDEMLTSDGNCYHQAAILFAEMEFSDEIKFNLIRNNGLFSVELLKS